MSTNCSLIKWIGMTVAMSMSLQLSAQSQLSLEEAVTRAQKVDPWLKGSQLREQAAIDRSIAAGQLPDPKISLGLANLPVSNPDFGREPMTQIQVGISQVFPRGEELELTSQRFREMSEQHPYMRMDRQATVEVNVTLLWLDAYFYVESIRMLEKDRVLFEDLVDQVRSKYANNLGRASQHDLVRAQLELTRLDDRITGLHSKQESSERMLMEWLYDGVSGNYEFARLGVKSELPELALKDRETVYDDIGQSMPELAEYLVGHPAVLSLDQKITVQSTDVEIARQSYKPQWGVNAAYGFRDEDPMGMDRSDFFSIGVSLDIPIFVENRQDRQVQSAISEAEALKTDRALLLRQMRARFESKRTELLRLDQRQHLYQSRLLDEMAKQAEAALIAYTNDEGDFAEVIRAHIAELNARIDALSIEIDRLKAIAQLNYFFVTADTPVQPVREAAERDNS